jgi:hypothetical protein
MEASGKAAGALQSIGKELSHGRSSWIRGWPIKSDTRIPTGCIS